MAATKENFAAAAQEVATGSIDAGLWAMATARARGDATVTEAIYLELRAEELAQARAHEYGRVLANAAKDKIEQIGSSAWQIAVLWFYCYLVIAFIIVFIGVLFSVVMDIPDGGRTIGWFVGSNILYIALAALGVAVTYHFSKSRR